MDRSHRQQTPLSLRPPSPAWTGLTASRLPSPRAHPPPHGQVSSPADSPLPTLALPRTDRSHHQQTPPPHTRPPPHGTGLIASSLPRPTPALPRMGQVSPPADSLSPRSPSLAWTPLAASRLSSPHTRPPLHGQVSSPADSPLPALALPRMDRSHRPQTPQQKIRSLAASDSAICISEPHPN